MATCVCKIIKTNSIQNYTTPCECSIENFEITSNSEARTVTLDLDTTCLDGPAIVTFTGALTYQTTLSGVSLDGSTMHTTVTYDFSEDQLGGHPFRKWPEGDDEDITVTVVSGSCSVTDNHTLIANCECAMTMSNVVYDDNELLITLELESCGTSTVDITLSDDSGIIPTTPANPVDVIDGTNYMVIMMDRASIGLNMALHIASTSDPTCSDEEVVELIDTCASSTIDGPYAWITYRLLAKPADGETVTLDGKVYTYKTVLSDVDGYVLLDPSAPATIAARDNTHNNLKAAVNREAGAGVTYAASTTLHPTISASRFVAYKPFDMYFTAKVAGPIGDLIVTSDTVLTGGGQWILPNGTTTTGPANLLGGEGIIDGYDAPGAHCSRGALLFEYPGQLSYTTDPGVSWDLVYPTSTGTATASDVIGDTNPFIDLQAAANAAGTYKPNGWWLGATCVMLTMGVWEAGLATKARGALSGCFTAPRDDTYYLLFGVDNYGTLKIDNYPIMVLEPTAGAPSEPVKRACFNYTWGMPVVLTAGNHIITGEFINSEDQHNIVFSILDKSYAEVVASTSYAALGAPLIDTSGTGASLDLGISEDVPGGFECAAGDGYIDKDVCEPLCIGCI